MKLPFNMTCPYCTHKVTITNSNYDSHMVELGTIDCTNDMKVMMCEHIICPNSDCMKTILKISLYYIHFEDAGMHNKLTKKYLPILSRQLLPISNAKPMPSYIPEAIKKDYEEACLIQSLSPKSAATLARRCLQGMIRDFWGIKKGTLKEEISELQGKITQDLWQAIDALRNLGNIGAHMEKDINVIIDIDEGEADTLIALIETLVEEWYIHREEQNQQLAKIVNISNAKLAIRTSIKTSQTIS